MTYKEIQRRRLRQYLIAEEKVLLNQSYQIGERSYTRADLAEIRKMINSLLESGVTLEDEGNKKSRVKRAEFI